MTDLPISGSDMAGLAEVIIVVQGQRDPRAHHVHKATTVSEFARVIAQAIEIDEALEIFPEDAEVPLAGDLILIEQVSVEIGPLHVARHGAKIAVKVEYNMREIERHFRPNATIERITRWAIGGDGFKLEGDPSDYQLKHVGEVLPPDTHLGQVPHPHDGVKLSLVFKVKPQGSDGFV